MTDQSNAAQPGQDPIYDAIFILTEEADSLSECHTRTPDDWTGEPEAKARYDHVLAVVAALSKLRAEGVQAGDERALPPLPKPAILWHSDFTDQTYYGYTADHMRDYGRAALASAPVADQAVGSGRNMFYEGLFDDETERQRDARLRWANDMRAAFERHTGNGWFDKDWHRETGIWAAAWKAATADSAPVAGEAIYQTRRIGDGGCNWEDVTQQQYEAAKTSPAQRWERRIVYAAPQASEAVRPDPDAIDLARAGMELHSPGMPEHTVCAELVRLADALKSQPQVDKDGGDCAKGAHKGGSDA